MLDQVASIFDVTVAQLELFFLVLIRLSGLIFLLPIFKNSNVSSRLKVGFAFVFALLVFPGIKDTALPYTPEVGHLVLMVVKELMIGILMGFAGGLLFVFIDLGGEVMNRNIGLSMMPMMNPETGESSTPLTQFIYFLFIIIFMLQNHHFFFVQIIHDSFRYIPVSGFELQSGKVAEVLTYLVSEALVTGMRLAAPILVTTLLALLGMAFMSRAMPNMNVWMMSVPVKIYVGTMTLIFVLPAMYKLLDSYFSLLQYNMYVLLKLGGGHG